MTNAMIVISHQTPQEISATLTPKVGEKLWVVVAEDGDTYKPIKLCIANSDKWSSALDFSIIGLGGAITPTSIGAEPSGTRTFTPTLADPGNSASLTDAVNFLLAKARDQTSSGQTVTYNGDIVTHLGQTVTYTV